jgi:hypothetical protein
MEEMILVIVVFGFMVLVVLFMAIGVIVGRKPIAGSCGGLSGIGMNSACDLCGGNKDTCKKNNKD